MNGGLNSVRLQSRLQTVAIIGFSKYRHHKRGAHPWHLHGSSTPESDMYGQNRLCAGSDRSLNCGGVHCQRARIDIDQRWLCSRVKHCYHAGNKSKRYVMALWPSPTPAASNAMCRALAPEFSVTHFAAPHRAANSCSMPPPQSLGRIGNCPRPLQPPRQSQACTLGLRPEI